MRGGTGRLELATWNPELIRWVQADCFGCSSGRLQPANQLRDDPFAPPMIMDQAASKRLAIAVAKCGNDLGRLLFNRVEQCILEPLDRSEPFEKCAHCEKVLGIASRLGEHEKDRVHAL